MGLHVADCLVLLVYLGAITAIGAWAATLTAFGVWWLTTQQFVVSFLAGLPFAEFLRIVTGQPDSLAIYLPWQMIFYLVAGSVMGIAASLLTRPVPKARLDVFYSLIRTPIQPGETIETPCTLPKGVVVPDRKKFFPRTNLEIPVPSWTSVVGFLAGWACVAALIAAVYAITR